MEKTIKEFRCLKCSLRFTQEFVDYDDNYCPACECEELEDIIE